MTTISKIAVLGCGALGSRIALELADKDLWLELYDRDKVAADNIGPSAFSRFDIGKSKAFALAGYVGGRNGNALARTVDVTKAKLAPADLVIDCLDNAEARNYMMRRVELPIVHVGVNWGVGEVVWGKQLYFAEAGAPVCTHELGRGIIGLTAAVASVAIQTYLATMNKANYLINVDGTIIKS